MPLMLRPEVEHWYVMPSLRKAIVKVLKGKGFSQKDIAKLLGITPAAISQYVSNKRAFVLDKTAPQLAKKIMNCVREEISKNNAGELDLFKLQAAILRRLEQTKVVCQVHKAIEGFENCTMEEKCGG